MGKCQRDCTQTKKKTEEFTLLEFKIISKPTGNLGPYHTESLPSN